MGNDSIKTVLSGPVTSSTPRSGRDVDPRSLEAGGSSAKVVFNSFKPLHWTSG